MTLERLIRVLLSIWDELPKLVGASWPYLLPRLAAILARADDATGVREEALTADLVSLLREYPEVRTRIVAEIQGATAMDPFSRGPTLPKEPHKPPSSFRSSLDDLHHKIFSTWAFTLPAAEYDDLRRKGRVVNLTVTSQDSLTILPAGTCLGVNQEYRVRLDIAPLSPESVVTDPIAFPADQLPMITEGHWLDVQLTSDDFIIHSPAAKPLFLPHEGASWVCDCSPASAHRCKPASRPRYLFFSVRPERIGDARLRVGIYFERNLVQSLLLDVRIETTQRAGAGHRAHIDYTLTNFLTDVSFLRPRTLHILTTGNPEGTHRLVINSRDESLTLRLTEGQLRDAIQSARRFLRDAHIEETRSFLGQTILRNRLDANNSKGRIELIADLKRFASLGSKLWAMLFEDQPDWWKDLSKPSTIQVSRIANSRFVFPWALLYDLPIEPGDPNKYRECRLLTVWENEAPRIDASARSCPFEAEHSPMNTICPFGFWGFKHVIEQPPSMAAGRNLPLSISVANKPPKFVAGLSRELDAETTTEHLLKLAPVEECDSLDGVRSALGNDIEIVYFYVHGRRNELAADVAPSPALQVGKGEWFEPDHLVAWRRGTWPPEHWSRTSPLVFINGCHTAEITPESLVTFVDSFSAALAAGVVGTEITLEQRLASEVAERFFKHFRAGSSVGEALQMTRVELLKKGNLLGLAYTPYCSADLRLAS